jgi:protease-4
LRTAIPRSGGFWVALRLGGVLPELAPPLWPRVPEGSVALLDVLRALDAAARDPRVVGVVVRIAGVPGGWSRLHTLRRALAGVRASGKPVVAYAHALAVGDTYLASAASHVFLPESGAVHLVGLRAEGFFLHELLTRLDVTPEVLRVGAYKSAAETFTRDAMSPEAREQADALLDDLYAELVRGIAEGRGLSEADVRARIDAGPYTARGAIEAGLVDGCVYPDEIEATLAEIEPSRPERGPDPSPLVDASLYATWRAADPGWRPLVGDLPRLAYVVASGVIARGDGLRGLGSDALRALLERVRRDDGVRGVVLRVDSPGGDGLATDLVWRAVHRTTYDKPVVVSMGDVAASGGYYVAAAADRVLAEAGTLTGSIGVVGGKVNLAGLYRRLGVAKDGVERGARAGLLSETRGFTPDERAALRGELESVYDTFLRRVSDGRGMSRAAVEQVAQGRVWSGARAKTLGLVDALGGPLEALADVRRLAGLAADVRCVVEVHPRVPRFGGWRALLGLGAGGLGA